MLTVAQKKAAVFAHKIDQDVNVPGQPGQKADAVYQDELQIAYAEDEHGRVDKAAIHQQAEEMRQMYLTGTEVLAEYSLSFTSRRNRGIGPRPDEIADADDWLNGVFAGHVATSEQECTAIFKIGAFHRE